MSRSQNPRNDPVDQIINNYFPGEIKQTSSQDVVDNDTDKLLYGILSELRGRNEAQEPDLTEAQYDVFEVTANSSEESIKIDYNAENITVYGHELDIEIALKGEARRNRLIPIPAEIQTFEISEIKTSEIWYKTASNVAKSKETPLIMVVH